MGNEKDNRLEDVLKEEKFWRKKQYDFEWNEDKLNATWCKKQADYYKNLILQGVLWEPKF